jgi:heme exporter protein B
MMRVARMVWQKDLRIEWRTRVVLWQVVPFTVATLLLFGLAFGPAPAHLRVAAPGAAYVALVLTTLLVIGRSRSHETAPGTATSVRMLGLDPAGVFLGKTLALVTVLALVAVLVLGGVGLFFHVPWRALGLAAPSLLLTVVALATAGTTYGALTGSGAGATTLLPALALPAFAPALVAGAELFAHPGDGRWWSLLACAVVAYGGVGLLLYGVVEEW